MQDKFTKREVSTHLLVIPRYHQNIQTWHQCSSNLATFKIYIIVMMFLAVITTRTSTTTRTQFLGSSKVILFQEGSKPGHRALRVRRKVPGGLRLVLYEVAKSTVDRGGIDGCVWNMPDLDHLHLSTVSYGLVEEITVLRVSLQTRR
jgi:hypothetical protein